LYTDFAREKGMKMFDIHTSGHADIPTLQRFAESVNADTVVPIHTFFPEKFQKLFKNTKLHKDNEVFEV
jgi:ribonuclease J